MARRIATAEPVVEVDPAWRYSWLVRSTLAGDERTYELVTGEARRLTRLPIGERVARMEAFLDQHDLLGRAERLIGSLREARSRWGSHEL